MTKTFDLDVTPANQPRKPERAREADWIRAFLHRVQIGHLATRWDDQPFITPLLFWYDEEENKIFFHHAKVMGRLRANLERHNRVCFEAFNSGSLLPSNVALEFSIQYASVVIFGTAHIIENEVEKRRILYSLVKKYFPDMSPGEEYRPITDNELAVTNVYAIDIERWSGKENWPEKADQSNAWSPLDEKLFTK